MPAAGIGHPARVNIGNTTGEGYGLGAAVEENKLVKGALAAATTDLFGNSLVHFLDFKGNIS